MRMIKKYLVFAKKSSAYSSPVSLGRFQKVSSAAKVQGERSTGAGVYTEYTRIPNAAVRSNSGAQYIFRSALFFSAIEPSGCFAKCRAGERHVFSKQAVVAAAMILPRIEKASLFGLLG